MDRPPLPAQSSPYSLHFTRPKNSLPQLPTTTNLQRTPDLSRPPISLHLPPKASTTPPSNPNYTPVSDIPAASRKTEAPFPSTPKPYSNTTPWKRKPVPVKTDGLVKLPEAKTKLAIIVVGAGISGLTVAIGLKSAGHEVTILEASEVLADIGAGIQIAPNATRILGRLGLLQDVMQHATVLESCSMRRWEDDSELGNGQMGNDAERRYGAPLGVVHRGDLQAVLLAEVRRRRIPIHLSSRVVEVDEFFGARVKLERGQWLSADVVLACDGIKSTVRRQIAKTFGLSDMSVPTGDAAYRLQIPRSKIANSGNKRVKELINRNTGTRWLGPGGHIMAYPIRRGTIYNMVLMHPDTRLLSDNGNTGKRESWTNKGSKKEMVGFYKAWNPVIRDLIDMVPNGEVLEWTLNTHHPLPSWSMNRCALLGDACHPMLPYVAQGAAQGIEDAAVLTLTLSLISSKEEIGTALGVYELVRKERAERVQRSAERTRNVLHFVDGEEQIERDMKMRGASESMKRNAKDGEWKRENPDQWCDREWQDFMWGTDIMQQTVDNWCNLVQKVERRNVTDLNATMCC
ncbi:hypothetical protein BGZ60DRAFT_387644 [Tricladium varicosporioides]|nr:hypothetical protein BGZ60DRAFT_387644 [Hymenoscyphus varicosporioides]